jgi:transposase
LTHLSFREWVKNHRHQRVSSPSALTSTVEAYRDEIAAWRTRGLETAAIRARLEEAHGHPVSYSAVWRLVQRLRAEAGDQRPDVVVRVEVKPGSEAQVDFGYAGLTVDPQSGAVRKTWVFEMVLAYSRHQYAELVFDQRVETWLLCHAHAFAFFGGVPERVVPDNLKAAVVRASFTEPEANRAYRECAEHYGFLIDPNPPRSPHLKGKVEQGGVHYVKRNFLAGRCALESPPQPVDALNAALRRWCREVAGQRVHGTTKQQPLRRFQQGEQAALRSLPPTPYQPAVWKRAQVYRDGYVTFEGAYYSVPYRLAGQAVWIRGGARTVELYSERHELVATHDRARAPGERLTHLAHLPPEKVAGLTISRESCQAQAAVIGPATAALVDTLLAHRPEDRLRSAGRLLRLASRTSPAQLEQACARAQAFGAADYSTVKRILAADQEFQVLGDATGETGVAPPALVGAASTAPRASRPYIFMRQASEFVASLFGAGGAAQ